MKRFNDWQDAMIWGVGFIVSIMVISAGMFSALYFGLKHIINIVGG